MMMMVIMTRCGQCWMVREVRMRIQKSAGLS